MNIMVFNVPAESVGALSILNQFHSEAKLSEDKRIKWTFVVSKPELEVTDNINVQRFPWVKKSWLHRYYFDHIVAPNLIKKYKVDKVLSLQNLIIPHTKVPQTLYVHNCLPFIDYKFTFKENRLLWIYQNIIGRKIIKSIAKADKVIVQSEWMQKACVKKGGVKIDKVDVVKPRINLEIEKSFEPNEKSLSTFFYPASEFVYKNHKLILLACEKLKNENKKNFKVLFTLMGDENDHISEIFNEVREKHLPIEFIGILSRDQVFELYTKSILLFPSYIESFGLPLLEAKLHDDMIFASDCPFSHDILDGYDNAYFFDPFDPDQLADLMERILQNTIEYNVTETAELKKLKDQSKRLADGLIF